MIPEIKDETEIVAAIVVNQRAYAIPGEVMVHVQRLRLANNELLNACKRVLRAIEWSATSDRMSSEEKAEVLRSAIAKAEGML